MKIRRLICMALMAMGGLLTTAAADFGKSVTWDKYSLKMDGRRVCPVMGEIHYSRLPQQEWQQEVRKMKEGGVTIIATYVFWNHIEEEEGIFRWDGQRDLRRFLEICKQEEMPVVLRLGPFCHGEVRNGGIPDWVFTKGCRLREQNSVFLGLAEKLYRQIFTQVQGLQWKDGGPVLAAQFDNEYRGRGEYLMDLKKIALRIGFDLPFYTRTGWPELRTPVPFGEMLPLYGDYADGFWDKDLKETCGNYYKAFNFKAFRSSTAIGTDLLGKQEEKTNKGDELYPYLTCELGGGMATAYHRRPFIYPEDSYSMALVKLGSGSNLLGYYMYHGGTNPEGRLNTLNECQTSPGTANNDLPVCTYDFQAPLGEFGQTYPQYYMLRPLHLFMHDYGELLAPMEASFPAPQDIKKGQDTELRWAVRSMPLPEASVAGAAVSTSAFVFVNNYERLQNLSEKKSVQLSACGVVLPRLTIPAGCMAIFPVNIDGIRYATAQLVAKRDGKIYMMQVKGVPTTIAMQNGKTLKNVKPKGMATPIYNNIYLLTQQDAELLFLPLTGHEDIGLGATCTKVREAGPLRQRVKGKAKVAEAPAESDWQQAAVYKITVPQEAITRFRRLLSITYQGDCARLYAVVSEKGSQASPVRRLIADNFQYGRPFLYGLWRLPEGCTELELRILPCQPDAPIYMPREADKTAGESVKKVEITYEGL
ncbi:MAG: beta-galactosidase [Prevotella sp.]|nr:beta-galactosidase [Prevotella sp.]